MHVYNRDIYIVSPLYSVCLLCILSVSYIYIYMYIYIYIYMYIYIYLYNTNECRDGRIETKGDSPSHVQSTSDVDRQLRAADLTTADGGGDEKKRDNRNTKERQG